MYRLLIVDDEPIIVDGLVQLFEENKKYEFDICKAYTANNALDILKKTKIDILLLDIRMPGMNGLQLADQVALYWPSCKIIFLTGYDEFDYIYTAIKKPGVNYILKTEGDEVIVGAVENAVKKIIEEDEQRNTIERAKKQMDMIIPLLRKDLFNSIFNSPIIDERNLKENFQELGIELDTSLPVLVLAGWVEHWPENLSYPDKIYMLGMVEEIFSKQLSGKVIYEYVIFDNNRCLLLLQCGEDAHQFRNENEGVDWTGLKAYVKATLEVIQDTCRNLYGFDISFVLARDAVKWNNIKNELDIIRSIMEKRSLPGQQMLIDAGMPNEIFNIDQKFLVIERIQQYINENVSGDLSLTKLAEVVYFNPSYLSRFYKQMTGRNLSEYINSVKFETSKRMLQDSSMKISEIGFKIGFEAPSCFTAFFKKMAKMTPQEYRDSLIRME